MTWWVVRATQDEVQACIREAGLQANVSPASRTGLVCAAFADLDEVPALLPDRDQFEITGPHEAFVVSGWCTSGAELHWSPTSNGPEGRDGAVAFFTALGADPDDVRFVLQQPELTFARFYFGLVPLIGLPDLAALTETIVAFDGDPDVARRMGHLLGPSVLVAGDSGWTYLKFPGFAVKRALDALEAFSQLPGASGMPFLVGSSNTGWFARFHPTHHNAFLVGPTWGTTRDDVPTARLGDSARAEFFVAEGRGPEVVESLLAQADAGTLPLGDFLARFGLPTFTARLLGTFGDEVGDRAEHLAKMSPEEVKQVRTQAAVYAATAPANAVSAGFAMAAGTLFVLLAVAAAARGSLAFAFVLLGLAVLMWTAGYVIWRWRGRFLWFRRPSRLS